MNPFNILILPFLIFHVSSQSQKFHSPSQTYSIDNRIIGGQPAKLGQLPYQLQLRIFPYGHYCGATLVNPPSSPSQQIAITAAHCVTQSKSTLPLPIPVSQFQLRAGTVGLNQIVGQTLHIRKIIIHPSYIPLDGNNALNGSLNDIAVILPKGKFKLNQNVQPLPLPPQDLQTTGMVTVSGWGLTNSSGNSASGVLRVVQLPIVPSPTCNAWYTAQILNATSSTASPSSATVIYPSNLCAGFEQGGKSTCSGDSGGPAVGIDSGKSYLAGIVSWGNEVCDAPKSPGVFTRVSSYITWITSLSRNQ